jgi:hypothetical protein
MTSSDASYDVQLHIGESWDSPMRKCASGLVLSDHPGMTILRNDVRRDLVFDEGDAVAQLQLAFFQPL